MTYTLRPLEWSTITPRMFLGTITGLGSFVRYTVSQQCVGGRWSLACWMAPQPHPVDYATKEGAVANAEDHWRKWAEANVVEVCK